MAGSCYRRTHDILARWQKFVRGQRGSLKLVGRTFARVRFEYYFCKQYSIIKSVVVYDDVVSYAVHRIVYYNILTRTSAEYRYEYCSNA